MSTACSISNEWLYILTINRLLMSQRERGLPVKTVFQQRAQILIKRQKKNLDPRLRTDFSRLICEWNCKLNSEVSKQTF